VDRPDGTTLRLLTETELQKIERAHPDGVTSGEIIGFFEPLGIRLSEATFRKYVQLGLLPRCKRVGQKGKHKGSQGIYPVRTVRLINDIKRMMTGEATLEELAATVFALQGPIDTLEDGVDGLVEAFRRVTEARVTDAAERKALEKNLQRLEADMQELLGRVADLRNQLQAATGFEDEAAERRHTA
jgi:uncharacterized coiled-coil protein SlyX